MTNRAEKSPEQGFDLERFKDEFFDLVLEYKTAIRKSITSPQDKPADLKTPHENVKKFYVDATIPPEQMEAVNQATTEILFGASEKPDKELQMAFFKSLVLLLREMTLERLKKIMPETTPEDLPRRLYGIPDRG